MLFACYLHVVSMLFALDTMLLQHFFWKQPLISKKDEAQTRGV